ncbi:type II toxin-antitoxin system RelE family toxin [Mesorhizobium xinjiangense]|uniref:type II toxin-antitoxin system RelE family toxin n=1 Tax=Mesorhizobium xinjiangense TaxID=2678685 RepID=UPI002E26C493
MLERNFAICYRFGMREVTYSQESRKALRRVPANIRRRIIAKIEQFAADPVVLANNVKALKGKPGYLRLRVGDWRVIFRDDGAVVAVIRVAPRGDAYD